MNDLVTQIMQACAATGPLGLVDALELAGSLLTPIDVLGALIARALGLPLIGSLVVPAAFAFHLFTTLLTLILALGLLLLSHLTSAGAADLAALAHTVTRVVQLVTPLGGQ
jgi:hypothetical protein